MLQTKVQICKREKISQNNIFTIVLIFWCILMLSSHQCLMRPAKEKYCFPNFVFASNLWEELSYGFMLECVCVFVCVCSTKKNNNRIKISQRISNIIVNFWTVCLWGVVGDGWSMCIWVCVFVEEIWQFSFAAFNKIWCICFILLS